MIVFSASASVMEYTELVARIQAALRKQDPPALDFPGTPYVLGDLVIYYAQRSVSVAGVPVDLTPLEFRLLAELSANAGQLMTHEQVLQRVWGQDNSGGSGPVRTYVKRLRRKLDDDPDDPVYNFTRRRVGYWMEKGEGEGILKVIDRDSYRVDKQTAEAIILADENAEIDPTPATGGGHIPELDMNPLSVILEEFNQLWGTEFTDSDQVRLLIAGIPERVESDEAYRIAIQGSDEENARIEHDHALEEVVMATLESGAELYKFFSENESFKRWLRNKSFSATYHR